MRDGQVIWKGLQRKAISRHDLEEALRLQARTDKIDDVREARCERNGDISIVKQPRIVEVRVEAGVQTVRLEIS